MKKLLVLFLSVILLFAVPAVSVAAANQPTFVISTAKGDAGDTVKITVSTQNNTGIISMKLLVKYDTSALKLTDVKEDKFSNVAFSPMDNNPFIINWVDPLSPDNETDGVVATLTFKILDTAPQGKSDISLTYDPENVFDMNLNNVTFGVENGYVDITNPNAPADNTLSVDSQEQQPTDSTDSSGDDQTNSNVPDSTHSQILEQIYNSANGENNNSQNDSSVNSDTNVDESQNGWIIWVVIAAVVVLCGAFAVVIIKSKKDK